MRWLMRWDGWWDKIDGWWDKIDGEMRWEIDGGWDGWWWWEMMVDEMGDDGKWLMRWEMMVDDSWWNSWY